MKNAFDLSSGYRKFCSSWWKHWFSPWLYINAFKWSYQRVTRGWADCDIWSMDNHLSDILPEMLTLLKTKKQGVPCNMFPEDYDHTYDAYSEEEYRKHMDAAVAKWNGILDKIILGFKSYERVQEHDWPEGCKTELETSTGISAKLGLNDVEYNWEAIRAWEKERMAEFDEGWDLMREHFGSLWD